MRDGPKKRTKGGSTVRLSTDSLGPLLRGTQAEAAAKLLRNNLENRTAVRVPGTTSADSAKGLLYCGCDCG